MGVSVGNSRFCIDYWRTKRWCVGKRVEVRLPWQGEWCFLRTMQVGPVSMRTETWEHLPATSGEAPHNQPLLSRKINNPNSQRKSQTVKCKLFIGLISYSLYVLLSQTVSHSALLVLPSHLASESGRKIFSCHQQIVGLSVCCQQTRGL